MNKTTIYTSPCIVANEHKVIRNGAVAVHSGRIIDVGPASKLIERWGAARIINRGGIFLPALVNCHTHLELSHLSGISKPEPDSGMTAWIEEVLHERQHNSYSKLDLTAIYADSLNQQTDSGVILLADISNAIDHLLYQVHENTDVYRILEVIAPTMSRTEEAISYVEKLPTTLPVSPHSPYSTSAHLIQYLKKRAQANNQIFSIHLAESAAELELLETRTGEFRRLLEKRDSWDNTLLGDFSAPGSVYYLESLGALDERTMCVHCVHLSDEEIKILADKNVKVCICPGSNTFLGVGRAPLEKLLQAGILPGIGTDSTASNETLNMWREMQILKQQFPDVPSAKILAMATLGGAISLRCENDYGTIEKGKKSIFLEINRAEVDVLHDAEIVEMITSEGMPEQLTWITPATEL